MELRLIDPDGYVVPGTIHLHVPRENAAGIEDRLRHHVAPIHAAHNGYYAADYRVQKTPEPTVAGRGTFLNWLTTAA